MRILNISLDKNITDKNSAAAKRMIEYGNLVERYVILVLADKNEIIDLSDRTEVIVLKKGGKFFNLLKLKKQAAEILKKEKYDVITVQDAYYLGFLAVKLARQFKLGLEIQVHGFEKFFGLRKKLAKLVLQKADSIRVVSQRLRRQLVNELKIAENKITVASIYADVAKSMGLILPSTREHNGKSNFIFLTVGRLVPVKNIAVQIEAMRQVIKQFSRAELWIVGDGSQRKALQVKSLPRRQTGQKPASSADGSKACLVGRRVKSQIKLFGWQENLDKFYGEADAFLLTSNSEGWGMAAVEAASFGLPIIMTDVGLAGEVIKDDESGIVIPVGDQKALENAMIKLIKDRDLRKKLGEGAREAIKKLPTKEETLALYKKSWTIAIANKNIK